MRSPSTEESCSTDSGQLPLTPHLPAQRAFAGCLLEAPPRDPRPGVLVCPSLLFPACRLHVAARGWGAWGCRGSRPRPRCRAQVTPSEGSPWCSRSPPPRSTFSYPEHRNPPAAPSQPAPGSRAPSRSTCKAPVATLIVLMLVVHRALGLERRALGCWGRGGGITGEEAEGCSGVEGRVH